jgi:hypothetical protein
VESPGGELFIWGTVWDTDRDALEFETAVRRAFAARYGGDTATSRRQVRVVRGSSGRQPSVVVWDLPANAGWTDELRALGSIQVDEARAVSMEAPGE